ncbi:MAG: hypothetical protein AAFZ92_00095 [Pseudomonadota bacterium]
MIKAIINSSKRPIAILFSTSIALLIPSYLQAQEQPLGEINLGTTIEGNRELPKVLYIIPWATPPGPGQVNPLVPHSANVFERAFSPVERLEQQRRIRYHNDPELVRSPEL